MSETDEATPLEAKAHKIVDTIVAKGADLVLHVHDEIEHRLDTIARGWDLEYGTKHGEFTWVRKGFKSGIELAVIIRELRTMEEGGGWKWVWACAANTNKGENNSIEEAMKMVDWQLELSGHVLVARRPFTTPWDVGVRRRGDWASKNTELARVWIDAEEHTWKWTLTRMAGPGPYTEHRTASSGEEAKARADAALREVGWVVRD